MTQGDGAVAPQGWQPQTDERQDPTDAAAGTAPFVPPAGARHAAAPTGQQAVPPTGRPYAPPTGQPFAPPAAHPYAPPSAQPFAPPAAHPYAAPSGQPYPQPAAPPAGYAYPPPVGQPVPASPGGAHPAAGYGYPPPSYQASSYRAPSYPPPSYQTPFHQVPPAQPVVGHAYGQTWQPYEPLPREGSQPTDAVHWLIPVGRSWQAVVAGYLGLVAPVVFPLAPFAIWFGLWAFRRAADGGHGRGRAVTGIVGGLLGVLVGVAVVGGLGPFAQ